MLTCSVGDTPGDEVDGYIVGSEVATMRCEMQGQREADRGTQGVGRSTQADTGQLQTRHDSNAAHSGRLNGGEAVR